MEEKSDKKILDVPHISQILDVTDSDWHNRACGIAVLAMVIKYYLGENSPSLDDLIKEGLSIDAYDSEYGWKHNHLTLVVHNHGLHSYRQEFKSTNETFEEGLVAGAINKFKEKILVGVPVIVSVEKLFRSNKSTHLVVLTGVVIERGELKGFYYHDPESRERGDGEHEFVSLERFLEFWRKMAIFISRSA